MLDWLKKLAGERPFENKAGLDEKAQNLLAMDFASLDDLVPGIAGKVMRFALDGQGEEVLDELGELVQAAEKLSLRCTQSLRVGSRTPRTEFFETIQCRSPEFFRRLGVIYQACARQQPRHQFRVFGDAKLDWLEILLTEATQLSVNMWPSHCRPCPAITAGVVEALIETEGLSPELLVRAAFEPQGRMFAGPPFEPFFVCLEGLGQSAVRHRRVLTAILGNADFKRRVYALEMMKKCRVPARDFLEELVAFALGTSKQVREHAQSLLADAKETACPLVERKIIEGTNEEKVHAVELLWSWEGEKARPFLQRTKLSSSSVTAGGSRM